MKKSIKYILPVFAAALTIVSCAKWTEAEPAMPSDLVSNLHGEDYYANLREYRKSDHQIMFGYYASWGGAGETYQTSLMGLPDSLDMVSMWGAGFDYTEAQKEDLRKAQQLKGLKCLMVFIVTHIGTQITPSWVSAASETNPVEVRHYVTGEVDTYTNSERARRAFWGLHPDDGTANTAEHDKWAVLAAEHYADSLCYLIDKLGLDGFDVDFEVGWLFEDGSEMAGDLTGYNGTKKITDAQAHDRFYAFSKRMRQGLGDKMLIIDGAPQNIKAPEACVFYDYFADQYYPSRSDNGEHGYDTSCDSRLQNIVNKYKGYLDPEFVASRYIIMDTFESHLGTGGCDWTDRNGTTYDVEKDGEPTGQPGSMAGMARWQPLIDGKFMRKGGVGAYLINMDYNYRSGFPETMTYPTLRECIQIMNPAVE